jgi:hypothetical protein
MMVSRSGAMVEVIDNVAEFHSKGDRNDPILLAEYGKAHHIEGWAAAALYLWPAKLRACEWSQSKINSDSKTNNQYIIGLSLELVLSPSPHPALSKLLLEDRR